MFQVASFQDAIFRMTVGTGGALAARGWAREMRKPKVIFSELCPFIFPEVVAYVCNIAKSRNLPHALAALESFWARNAEGLVHDTDSLLWVFNLLREEPNSEPEFFSRCKHNFARKSIVGILDGTFQAALSLLTPELMSALWLAALLLEVDRAQSMRGGRAVLRKYKYLLDGLQEVEG